MHKLMQHFLPKYKSSLTQQWHKDCTLFTEQFGKEFENEITHMAEQ